MKKAAISVTLLLWLGGLVWLAAPVAPAHADIIWTGFGPDSNWSDGANWTPLVVPNSPSTNVSITDGASTVTLDTNASVANLSLASGNTLSTDGTIPNLTLGVYGNQISNSGNIVLTGGGSNNTYLTLLGNNTVTLSGGGVVTLNTTTSGAAAAQLQLWGTANGYSVSSTLDNVDNTIQGGGIISGYGGGTLINENGGTINANSNITSLAIVGSVTNDGTMQASGNGILVLQGASVINNGTITANAGSSVNLSNNSYINGGTITANAGASVNLSPDGSTTTVVGSTLTNNNGAFLGTVAGGSAALFGITLNGTYTTDVGGYTQLNGPITNNGNLLVNGGGGSDTTLDIPSNTTLSGRGTVTLVSGNGNWAWLTIEDGVTLDNVGNTIQGSGVILNSNGTLINEAGGTILANSGGLAIQGSQSGTGNVTNYGTFQVNDGSALHLVGGRLTNFSGNTLTGGTYIVNGSGILQIDSLGTNGGEIVNNAASITLNGAGSKILDAQGQDALSGLASNTAAGSLTITGGRNLTTPGDFSNAGFVNVGAGSTFNTGPNAGNNFIQTGGALAVDGVLWTAQALVNAGTVSGGGTIQGNLHNTGGFVHPVSAGMPSTLSVTGNFTQDKAGTLLIDITNGQWSVLSVSGWASLDGTVDFNFVGGFAPVTGTFTYLTAGSGISGDFVNVEFTGYNPLSYTDNNGILVINPAPTPLPGSIFLLMGGLAGMGVFVRSKRKMLRL
ncbi:MAG: hypothetical protein ABSC19_08155 [Syntrophorhabdales bacterium]